MFKYLLLISIAIFTLSCSTRTDTEEKILDTIYINDYNVLLVPDLSNRIDNSIYPKPVNDTLLFAGILDSLGSLIDLKNRKTNQRDIYKFDFINKGILNQGVCKPENLNINLGRFKNNLIGGSDYIRNGLKKDVLLFKNDIKNIYDYSIKNPAGADLWNYFNETITSSVINRAPENITPKDQLEERVLYKQYKNIVVLLTDGYIENANKTKGYVLDNTLVQKIRKDFLASKNKDLKAFILANSNYHLNKTTNDLSGINILILEVMDRSLDKNGVAIKQPTDFQIMKIIWEEWLKNSGASAVEIHQTIQKKEDGYEILKKFMENV